MRQNESAAKCFKKALKLDSDNDTAFLGLARACAAEKEWLAAAEAALHAVELAYFNPQAHFLLGVSLVRLKRHQEALQALKLAVHQAPAFPAAHRVLARLCKELGRTEEQRWHQAQARLSREVKVPRGDRARSTAPTFNPPPEAAPVASHRVGLLSHEGPAQWPQVPDSELITVVSGLPRSGTSMIM